MGMFGCLFMMILIPALFVLALVLNVVFRVLGVFVPKSRKAQPQYDYDESDNPIENEIREEVNERRQRGEKIIADNEGEYVDFEEIKEGLTEHFRQSKITYEMGRVAEELRKNFEVKIDEEILEKKRKDYVETEKDI